MYSWENSEGACGDSRPCGGASPGSSGFSWRRSDDNVEATDAADAATSRRMVAVCHNIIVCFGGLGSDGLLLIGVLCQRFSDY